MKFTFKTTGATGKFRSFSLPIIDIKLNKKLIGSILPETPYLVSFMVNKQDIYEDNNSNCAWKWVRLKKEFRSIDEAKEFINNNIDKILEKFDLHCLD